METKEIDKDISEDRKVINLILALADMIDACPFCIAIKHDTDSTFRHMIITHWSNKHTELLQI